MSPEDKEEQYNRMGLPPIKWRKLYFKTVELFPYCISKYFKSIIQSILSKDLDDFGGLKDMLNKFYSHVE